MAGTSPETLTEASTELEMSLSTSGQHADTLFYYHPNE